MSVKLEADNAFFSVERQGEIFVIRQKPGSLRHAVDLSGIAAFFESLDHISSCKDVRAAVFLGPSERLGGAELMEVYRLALASKREDYVLQRLFNVVNNYVLRLASLDKITIRADQGRIDAFFFNMSLASDYRIVSEQAIYENPCLELGLVSKGGGGFFLSHMLGSKRAGEVMLRTRMLPEEALRLGLVDKIVPAAELEAAAMETARAYLEKPAEALLNVRKLLKGDQGALRKSLELEDLLIMNRVNADDFPGLLEKALGDNAAGAAEAPVKAG